MRNFIRRLVAHASAALTYGPAHGRHRAVVHGGARSFSLAGLRIPAVTASGPRRIHGVEVAR